MAYHMPETDQPATGCSEVRYAIESKPACGRPQLCLYVTGPVAGLSRLITTETPKIAITNLIISLVLVL